MVLGLAGAMTAQAQNGGVYPAGDVLIGFTTGSGNDVVYDLGQESALSNGETWNLEFLLTAYGNYSALHWGVVAMGPNSGSPRTAWTSTAVGTIPGTIASNAKFSQIYDEVGAIYENFTNSAPGQWASVASSSSISWYTETYEAFTSGNTYVNNYENPNVTGVGSASFSQILGNSTAPTLLGSFALAANGVVTYTTNSTTTPPTASFSGSPTAGFAPLSVVFTNNSTGSITNWVWSFGNGTSVTNTTGSNVTNTYAASGTYTVTLTVIGAGGTNASTMTGYIAVSSVPRITSTQLSGGLLILGGTNCPPGVEYRILSTTNLTLPLASWTPVATNTFLSNGTYSFTNSTSKSAAFFLLVSP